MIVLLANPTNMSYAHRFAEARRKKKAMIISTCSSSMGQTAQTSAVDCRAQVSNRLKRFLIRNHPSVNTTLSRWYKAGCWSLFCSVNQAETLFSYLETLYDCLQINWGWQSITKSRYPAYPLLGKKIEQNEKIFRPMTSFSRHWKWMRINLQSFSFLFLPAERERERCSVKYYLVSPLNSKNNALLTGSEKLQICHWSLWISKPFESFFLIEKSSD